MSEEETAADSAGMKITNPSWEKLMRDLMLRQPAGADFNSRELPLGGDA
jgi:hypothetical protein